MHKDTEVVLYPFKSFDESLESTVLGVRIHETGDVLKSHLKGSTLRVTTLNGKPSVYPRKLPYLT